VGCLGQQSWLDARFLDPLRKHSAALAMRSGELYAPCLSLGLPIRSTRLEAVAVARGQAFCSEPVRGPLYRLLYNQCGASCIRGVAGYSGDRYRVCLGRRLTAPRAQRAE
jgi:hypothetical protein